MQNFIQIEQVLRGFQPNWLRTAHHPMVRFSQKTLHFPKYFILEFASECPSDKVVFASHSHFVRMLSGRPISFTRVFLVLQMQQCKYLSPYGAKWYLSASAPHWNMDQIISLIDFASYILPNVPNCCKRTKDI